MGLRMVNAMHARSDDQLVQEALDTNRKPQITMVKKHLRLKRKLVDGKGPRRSPDETYLDDVEPARKRDLAEVKAEGSRNVQLWIGMMNIMKAPEKRSAMVGKMPVIESEIHQQETERQFQPGRQSYQMDKTERFAGGRMQSPLRRWLDQGSCREESKSRDSYVDDEPSQERARAVSQRKGALESKEQPKKHRGDHGKRKRFHELLLR